MREAEKADFAIFVAGYDEKRAGASKPPYLLNQNVVLEMGLFAGRIGLERVYLLVPQDFKTKLKLPSDLDGLTLLTYDAARLAIDGNELAAIGNAANSLLAAIGGSDPTAIRPQRHETRLFPAWADKFEASLQTSKTLTVSFIHSRRWRENHLDTIGKRAKAGDLTCAFFVPDLRDRDLISSLTRRFDDGPTIPAMISDLFAWLIRLQDGVSGTKVHLVSRAPSYSYYRFDNDALLALYPNSTHRQASPTILIGDASPSWQFLLSDEKAMATENPAVDIEQLRTHFAAFNERWLPRDA